MDPKRTFRWRGLLAKTISQKKLSQKTGESIFLYFKYLSGIEVLSGSSAIKISHYIGTLR